MRGRLLQFQPDPRTRPMKQRVRESLFNLLGTDVKGKHAIDLFAGTGALAFEALSRGALSATMVERHFPTANTIVKSAAALELTARVSVLPANSLLWTKRMPQFPPLAWVVFCSPPYDLYVSQELDLLNLIGALWAAAPLGSLFAIEADERFDMTHLPEPDAWDVRHYPPAVLAIQKKN